MLERLGKKGGDVSDEEMAQRYEKHLKEMGEWLNKQIHMDVLYVRYDQVVQDPAGYSAQINHFLGGLLNEANMVKVVDPGLYRQRKDILSNVTLHSQ